MPTTRLFSVVASCAKTILMCKPSYFTVKYAINPWMENNAAVDCALADKQWKVLKQHLQNSGAVVKAMNGEPGVPDLVFTANAGLVLPKKRVVLSRFVHAERRAEEQFFRKWFESHEFEVFESKLPFEGAGDALFFNEILFAGFGQRTVAEAYQPIKKMGIKTVPCELVDHRMYHLDTAFCPLDAQTALWYPSAFSGTSQSLIKAAVPRLIAVSDEDVLKFACNAVIVGDQVVLPKGSPRVLDDLDKAGFDPVPVDMSEFIKAGGACKCLTLTFPAF